MSTKEKTKKGCHCYDCGRPFGKTEKRYRIDASNTLHFHVCKPCYEERTNPRYARRGKDGGKALDAYAKLSGDDGANNEDRLTDLLADLMHFANEHAADEDCPLDFEVCLERAQNHFEAETSYKCGNCLLNLAEDDLKEPRKLTERLLPGDRVPAGECPRCGFLAYRKEDFDDENNLT